MTVDHSPGAVVMAVFRPDPELLERQVRSLRAQSVRDWVCLVGIDGRDDATYALLTNLADDDPRIEIYHFEDNVGVYRQFERLLALVPAEAAWVALADQDDHWYDDKLERLLPALAEPGVSAVTGQAEIVGVGGDSRGRTDRAPGRLRSTLLRNQLTGSLAVMTRPVVTESLPFPPGNERAIHDHWLAVCASARGRIAVCPEVVQDYVQHDRNVIGEVEMKRLSQIWHDMRRLGGLFAYLDAYSGPDWEWRVSMANDVLGRGVEDGSQKAVEAVARGTLGVRLVRLVLSEMFSGRLPWAAGAGILLVSARRRMQQPRRWADRDQSTLPS